MLEKQFRNTYTEANRLKGSTGENLMKLLESRLDNVVLPSWHGAHTPAARQLVGHKHVMVNGEILNIPSYRVKPGDSIELKPKSHANTDVTSMIRGKNPKISGWTGMRKR